MDAIAVLVGIINAVLNSVLVWYIHAITVSVPILLRVILLVPGAICSGDFFPVHIAVHIPVTMVHIPIAIPVPIPISILIEVTIGEPVSIPHPVTVDLLIAADLVDAVPITIMALLAILRHG